MLGLTSRHGLFVNARPLVGLATAMAAAVFHGVSPSALRLEHLHQTRVTLEEPRRSQAAAAEWLWGAAGAPPSPLGFAAHVFPFYGAHNFDSWP